MKEDDEGILFHTLLTMGMHRGGQILPEKRAAAPLFMAAVLGIRGGAGGGGQGERLAAMLGCTEGRRHSWLWRTLLVVAQRGSVAGSRGRAGRAWARGKGATALMVAAVLQGRRRCRAREHAAAGAHRGSGGGVHENRGEAAMQGCTRGRKKH
jgi:hypothetical protein